MSESDAAVLFLVALPAVQVLAFLLCRALWKRDAAREVAERAHGVEVSDDR